MPHLDAVSLTIIIVGLIVCACAVVLITMHPKPARKRRADKARLKSCALGNLVDISRGETQMGEVMTNVSGVDVAVSFAKDIGARQEQQDAFGAYQDENRLLLTVCDGMGGMAMGAESSMTAVNEVKSVFMRDKSGNALINAIKNANSKVYDLCRGKGGSTCVAAVIDKNGLSYASVGDSRIYIYRKGVLKQLGQDHIFLYDLLENAHRIGISAQEAYEHPEREHLTSFIGRETLGRVNKNDEPISLFGSDIILMFTDGVYKTIDEDEIVSLLESGAEAKDIVSGVLARKKQRQDNLTVIKVRVL